ncbi:Arc family DNA-binding protein [Falsirhodobacter sp. 20TX0035]|uniref:Arc family DNA-binding protein n=1 Tax=Falsirhodobacter sp. 20TX0035 TaxID=3022019 RepID=UPI00232FAB7A|nr:Arc family DNA-binding protein [Falsirhodobacter sp. 20TX0035]MDB6454688.1 Arc family DNA-binding protein [Falsirhodobacter sp. 20TX0035]
MSVPTNRDSDKFVLRLPDGMRDRIKAAAEANSRSMNAEVVATLEEKYPAPEPEDLGERLKNLTIEIAEMPDPDERAEMWDYLRGTLLEMADNILTAKRASGNLTTEEEQRHIDRRKKIADSDISHFDLSKLKR